ncbi:DUF6221 family protein [Actinopolymorpha sp. B11F2]|uniref:DUF6221 family protein n=1 Tax=Actinopolymorpha sp. B11F2 TaxID=3160862 RepID=UPI0032E48ED1
MAGGRGKRGEEQLAELRHQARLDQEAELGGLAVFLRARLDDAEARARAGPRVGELRALREVDAKRRVVEVAEVVGLGQPAVVIVLRALATVYADHPDYQREWFTDKYDQLHGRLSGHYFDWERRDYQEIDGLHPPHLSWIRQPEVTRRMPDGRLIIGYDFDLNPLTIDEVDRLEEVLLDPRRQVALDDVIAATGGKVRISTIFLAIDTTHRDDPDGPPVLWHTAPFEEVKYGPEDWVNNHARVYASEQAARAGHVETVDLVRNGPPKH